MELGQRTLILEGPLLEACGHGHVCPREAIEHRLISYTLGVDLDKAAVRQQDHAGKPNDEEQLIWDQPMAMGSTPRWQEDTKQARQHTTSRTAEPLPASTHTRTTTDQGTIPEPPREASPPREARPPTLEERPPRAYVGAIQIPIHEIFLRQLRLQRVVKPLRHNFFLGLPGARVHRLLARGT